MTTQDIFISLHNILSTLSTSKDLFESVWIGQNIESFILIIFSLDKWMTECTWRLDILSRLLIISRRVDESLSNDEKKKKSSGNAFSDSNLTSKRLLRVTRRSSSSSRGLIDMRFDTDIRSRNLEGFASVLKQSSWKERVSHISS